MKITVLNRFHNPQKNIDCTNGIVCILYKFLTLKGSIFLENILNHFLGSFSYGTQVGDSSVLSKIQNFLESTIQRNLDYKNEIVCIMHKSLTQNGSVIFTTYLTLFFKSFTYETHVGDSSVLSRLQNSLESTTPHKNLYCNNCISVQSVERSQSQLAMRSNNGGVVQNQQHNNNNRCNNNNKNCNSNNQLTIKRGHYQHRFLAVQVSEDI